MGSSSSTAELALRSDVRETAIVFGVLGFLVGVCIGALAVRA